MARGTSPPAMVWHEAPERSLVLNLLISLRPGQWAKNLLVFAGLLFGLRLFDATEVFRAVAAFLIFCLLSGVVYLINDVADRESDRQHPLKARRPIASGALSVHAALTAAVLLGGVALVSSFALGVRFFAVSVAYLALLALYSGPLKHIVIIDVLTIAIGFVLRAVAGALAVEVEISHWLLVCTILLALFISLAKRRHELVLLADGAASHRPILGEYSPYLLDQMISVVTASTLIAYVFYTISPETEQKFGTAWLGLTIPFPLYGIFRYLYLVHQREGGGSPADLLLTDRPLLICVTLWAVAVALIIYRPL
ncbi:MAG TPA: decaprenyl-phosphate phosphoribosyltransferase [Vicinamibacterales bacterium]|nr:decaprenyl-phosphate phosphoribosyltransferase [Vicinamibacterales bacterium]